jgi:ferric-dicitrate binding protein FerR (iron transport regulator)
MKSTPEQPAPDHCAPEHLGWLAFRYVAGEMSPTESASFELLLSDDQDARDAVVRAVELTEAILATQAARSPAPVEVAATARQRWSQQIAWVATTVAACLLIALALNVGSRSDPSATSEDQLAKAWLDQVSDSPVAMSEAASAAPGSPTNGVSDDAELVTTDVPAWMVEAVRSLQSDRSPDADDSDAADEMES